MYGVALDPSGNYILLGGSGDEGPQWYNELNSAGWKSKVWVSYLVVVDSKVKKTKYFTCTAIVNIVIYQNVIIHNAGKDFVSKCLW